MSSQYVGFPAKRGLYDPNQERESCGVGFVCNIKGQKSRSILDDANNMNCSMRHRGGLGFEKTTGDGAGILTSIPDLLFRSICKNELDCNLPELGHYGVGNVFLPQLDSERETCRAIFHDSIEHCGLRVLSWPRGSHPTNVSENRRFCTSVNASHRTSFRRRTRESRWR